MIELNRIKTARAEHEVAYQDLLKLVAKHANVLSAVEILAIAANMTGKLIAMQDQRAVSEQRALEIVRMNMEIGNRQAIDEIFREAIRV